ncbi:LytR family transcriptional regulator [Cytobacillus sp. Hz8]|uniref:LCP family glycopolymer transferase n=1 Tax=Cytobacillus sp. Hz8 TaxID=3347168 RepID=UPI0035D62FEE
MGGKKKNKKRIALQVAGLFFLIVLVGIGVYGFTIYKSLTDTVETMHQPIDREISQKRLEKITLEKKDPFTVLMLGVDERVGDRGRSDTIIVLAVNPNNQSVKMLSIPRDVRTKIVGHDTVDKINHAYAFGDVKMAMETVENFLDIPIDYYLKINMEGFKDIVDAVGGVTLNNDLDFTSNGIHFKKGTINLNGDKALAFSRMRYEDPNGDFGRQHRQRQIIEAIIHEGASLSTLTNFGDIFNALGKNVKTNLNFNEMVDIQRNYKDASHQIDQISLSGQGTMIDGIYYILVPEKERMRVRGILKKQLEI